MPLLLQLVGIPETIQEFNAAAEDRFWDGVSLLVDGRYDGGIYLLGYVAEMLLKSAYFSFRGEALTVEVWPLLNPAWRRGADWFPGSFSANNPDYHNLNFWSRVLAEERRRAGQSLPFHLHNEYVVHTSRLSMTWWVEMRYRRGVAGQTDAEGMLESVTWLRHHYIRLAT